MLGNIDELNNYEYIYSDKEIDDFLTDYFSVMDISEKQKEKRIQVAKDFRNSLLFLFALIYVAYDYEYFSFDYIVSQFKNSFTEELAKHIEIDNYVEKYINKISNEIVETTYRNIDFENPTFWTSDERALIVGANESNSMCNYEDFQDAKSQGYTMKKWITEKDNRVRKTHKQVDEVTIPIDDYFVFPDCKGLFPHDTNNLSNKELANCRCTLEFL